MNQQELLEFFDQTVLRMRAIMHAKNNDYAGQSINKCTFANFTRVEALGIATTEQGFLTRMMDKLCRITTFTQKGVLSVADEKVSDTLLDLANYAILMAAYIHSKKHTDARDVKNKTDVEELARGIRCNMGQHWVGPDLETCVDCGLKLDRIKPGWSKEGIREYDLAQCAVGKHSPDPLQRNKCLVCEGYITPEAELIAQCALGNHLVSAYKTGTCAICGANI